MAHKQQLLVSVRGPKEAMDAARGGASIVDVEYPASALGTPYPLNIDGVCQGIAKAHLKVKVSTNIGEHQHGRSTACQAALGVAVAGAHLIKFGLAELSLEAAIYQGREIVRTVRKWQPTRRLYPAVFIDDDMQRFFKAFDDSVKLVTGIRADGVLIDTYQKGTGRGLLDYCEPSEIARWCERIHAARKEAWIAGSITEDELPTLWATGVDVICVRGAACKSSPRAGRFGAVSVPAVKALVATIPDSQRSR